MLKCRLIPVGLPNEGGAALKSLFAEGSYWNIWHYRHNYQVPAISNRFQLAPDLTYIIIGLGPPPLPELLNSQIIDRLLILARVHLLDFKYVITGPLCRVDCKRAVESQQKGAALQ